MSLEAQLEQLNKNVAQLITLLANPAQPVEAAAQRVNNTPAKPKPPGKPQAEIAAPLDYKPVGEAILKLASAKGRNTAIALLAKFNAKTGKELKPEQYAECLAAIEAELAA